jgi:hypothetical protein
VPTVSTAFMPCSTPLKYCACKPGCAAVVKTSSCVYARGHHPANKLISADHRRKLSVASKRAYAEGRLEKKYGSDNALTRLDVREKLQEAWIHRKAATKGMCIPGKKSLRVVCQNLGKEFDCRSPLEARFARYLDSCCVSFDYEQLAIPYLYRERVHHYYPDFVFRSTIVEIKTNASLRKNLKLERIKLRVGRFYAKEHGLKFRVITETWLNARGF